MTAHLLPCLVPERRSFEATAHEGTPSLVVVRGEVDVTTVPMLREVLGSCLERGPREVVLDLSALDFIGAQGLSLLLDTHKRLRRRGGGLSVHDAPASTARVLEITGMGELLADR